MSALAKQEEPVRWITYRGRRVPITTSTDERRQSQISAKQASDKIKQNIELSLTSGFRITDQVADIPKHTRPLFILPDGNLIIPQTISRLQHPSLIAYLISQNLLADVSSRKAFQAASATEKIYITDRVISTLVDNYNWVRVTADNRYDVGDFTGKQANTIDALIMRKGKLPAAVGIQVRTGPWMRDRMYWIEGTDYEDAGFSIEQAIQREYKRGQLGKQARFAGMQRLAADSDLLKISQAELDYQRTRLRQVAEHVATPYQEVFAEDRTREVLQRELTEHLLGGFEEILQRPGTGPRGTIGRTRMREAVARLITQVHQHAGYGIIEQALQIDTDAHLQAALLGYQEGRLTLEQLRHRSQRVLQRTYRQAYQIGKTSQREWRHQHRGETRTWIEYARPEPLTPADETIIQREYEEELGFLEGFLAEVERRQQAGIAPGAYLRWRFRLYSQALRGLNQRGLLAEVGPDDEIHWIVDPLAEHCPDCLQIAGAGPYYLATLPTVPRAGDTECLMNCQCHLRITYIEEGTDAQEE